MGCGVVAAQSDIRVKIQRSVSSVALRTNEVRAGAFIRLRAGKCIGLLMADERRAVAMVIRQALSARDDRKRPTEDESSGDFKESENGRRAHWPSTVRAHESRRRTGGGTVAFSCDAVCWSLPLVWTVLAMASRDALKER